MTIAPQPSSRPPAPAQTAKRTLLLVDDDPFCARFFGHAADECGCRAVVTMSAESFRRQYRERTPDIVMLDLQMPGADGVELLRFLAEEKCRAVVILVSGIDRRVLDAAARFGRAMGLNMGRSLSKPFRIEDLLSAIAGD